VEFYPENTVWYVEARPWQGAQGDLAGFAPIDPATRGSAVAIAFSLPEEEKRRQRRVFLLTCAHVVRDRQDNLLADIVCYPPGSGFVRTKENWRRSGTFPEAEAKVAKVSVFSPCRGVRTARPESLRKDPASDWVLLEVEDASFAHMPTVERLVPESEAIQEMFSVLGYPSGAGTWAEKDDFERSKKTGECHFWLDGRLVKPRSVESFRSLDERNPGMLAFEGGEETAPGMSGGGIFLEDGLVAIHRSSTEATKSRGGVLVETILKYLQTTHDFRFEAPPLCAPRTDLYWIRWNLGITAAFLGLLLLWAILVLGVLALALILAPLFAGGLGKLVELLFPESGYGKRVRRVQTILHRRSTTIVMALVFVAGLMLSFSGTMIHVASLPEGVDRIGISWGQPPATFHDTVAEGKSRWFWTFFGSTPVRFESSGLIPHVETVRPWRSTTLHGRDKLLHQPYVIVRLNSTQDSLIPAEDAEDEFWWKLRVRYRPAGDMSAAYAIWRPCDKYYVGYPLMLGGDGVHWPKKETLRELGLPEKVVLPTGCPCPLFAEHDYLVEVLDPDEKDVLYSVELSHEEIARIRSPIVKELVPRS
jgi:hypothetical protein